MVGANWLSKNCRDLKISRVVFRPVDGVNIVEELEASGQILRPGVKVFHADLLQYIDSVQHRMEFQVVFKGPKIEQAS